MDMTDKFIEECGGERKAVAKALAMIDRLIGQVQEANRNADQAFEVIIKLKREIGRLTGSQPAQLRELADKLDEEIRPLNPSLYFDEIVEKGALAGDLRRVADYLESL